MGGGVYLRIVAPCSRKLRCVVNNWYHRVVASRLLLFKIYKRLEMRVSAAISSIINTVKRLDFISRQSLPWDIYVFVMVLWSNKLNSP